MLIRALNKKNHACRREDSRQRWSCGAVTFWSDRDPRPCTIAAIEADTRGARLLLPDDVREGHVISVSFTDEVGHHRSLRARVVWTNDLRVGGRAIAGVMFLDQLGLDGLPAERRAA